MKPTINIIIFFLSIYTLNAQYKIQGTVNDFHNKTPLSNVIIELGKHKTLSDKAGNFILPKVAQGTYLLRASHPDCEPFSEEITVDKNLQLSLFLEHHIHEIETVAILGKHKNSGSLILKSLNKEELSRNITENLGNVLTSVSGVSVLKTGNNIAKPIIHGLYGSRISIMNDGVKMAEQEWGVEHAPNIDINNYQHIDVIKGASALKYGSDAIGGVIILEPENFPKKDTLRGDLSLTGISNGRGFGIDANLAQTWKSGWLIKSSGSMKKLGDLDAPYYNLKNTGIDFSSFNFALSKNTFKSGFSFDYYLTNQQIGILRDSHVSSFGDYERAMSAVIPVYSGSFSYDINNPKQEVEHHLAKISGYKRLENLGKISAAYSFQYNHRKEFDLRRGDLNNIPSLDLRLMTHEFTLNDLLEREKWSLESGINAGFQNNYSNPDTQTRRLVPNYDKYSLGAYSVFKYKFSNTFNTEAGIRYDYQFYDVTKWYDKSDWDRYYAADFSQFFVRTNANRVLTRPQLPFENFSYNVGLEYHPSKNFNLKLNYAKVGRTPNIAELFSDGLHHSAAIIERGNMGIKTEQGHQFNLLVDTKFEILNGLQISLNPYFFTSNSFINEIPNGVLQPTQAGTFPVWQYQQIKAKMYGIDTDISLGINDYLSYQGKASFVYGQDETHLEPLILMMPTNFRNSLNFEKKEWNQFYFNLENIIFLHQNRFPVHNLEYETYENGNLVDKTLDISTPPKGYSLWNIQTGIRFGKNFSTGLAINNIFNTSYRDYLNRLRLFADEAGRSFILNFKFNF